MLWNSPGFLISQGFLAKFTSLNDHFRVDKPLDLKDSFYKQVKPSGDEPFTAAWEAF